MTPDDVEDTMADMSRVLTRLISHGNHTEKTLASILAVAMSAMGDKEAVYEIQMMKDALKPFIDKVVKETKSDIAALLRINEKGIKGNLKKIKDLIGAKINFDKDKYNPIAEMILNASKICMEKKNEKDRTAGVILAYLYGAYKGNILLLMDKDLKTHEEIYDHCLQSLVDKSVNNVDNKEIKEGFLSLKMLNFNPKSLTVLN